MNVPHQLLAVAVVEINAADAAKEQRIAWQSSGIKLLHGDVATLHATVSMLQVQLQQGDGSRLTQLEADLALLTAQLRDVAV